VLDRKSEKGQLGSGSEGAEIARAEVRGEFAAQLPVGEKGLHVLQDRMAQRSS
jgi:hypothetical protein